MSSRHRKSKHRKSKHRKLNHKKTKYHKHRNYNRTRKVGAGVKKVAFAVYESPIRPKYPVMLPLFYSEPYSASGSVYSLEDHFKDIYYGVEEQLDAYARNYKGEKIPKQVYVQSMNLYEPLYIENQGQPKQSSTE